jgi:hypothetical protein
MTPRGCVTRQGLLFSSSFRKWQEPFGSKWVAEVRARVKVGQVVDATRRSARNIVRVTIILRVTMTTVRVTKDDQLCVFH